LCPTEVLHQLYEGIVNYALKDFFEPGSVKNLDMVMKHIIKSASNQSDEADYPSGSFSMGLSKLTKMKGIDKHASVFYLSIFLHIKVNHIIKFGGKKDME